MTRRSNTEKARNQASRGRIPISERRLLLGFGDLLAVNAAVLAALRIWAFVGQQQFNLIFVIRQVQWFVILTFLWLILAAANNFYDLALTARWAQSQVRLAQITLQLLVVYLLIFFLSARDALPRLFIVYYAVLSYVLIAVWRLGRPFLIGWVPLRRRAIIVGTDWAAKALIEAVEAFAPADYEVVGIVETSGRKIQSATKHLPVLSVSNRFIDLIDEHQISEVILTSRDNLDGVLFQGIMDCYERGIPVTQMPLLYERLTGMVPVEYVGGQWSIVLPLEGRSPFDPYPILKRAMDVVLSLVGLIIFAGMLPLIAAAIAIDSRGPIFYAQERTGKAGRVIRIIKMRTMIHQAEVGQGPLWAVDGDPRITRIGRFLRKSRLDEVPQLVNVLKGEMSLVGPRPERPFFVERLQEQIPFYRARLAILPGLTGWAQINYGYGSTENDALVKLKYDLYYIRHRSLLLDMLILIRTVARVVRLEGT